MFVDELLGQRHVFRGNQCKTSPSTDASISVVTIVKTEQLVIDTGTLTSPGRQNKSLTLDGSVDETTVTCVSLVAE